MLQNERGLDLKRKYSTNMRAPENSMVHGWFPLLFSSLLILSWPMNEHILNIKRLILLFPRLVG